MWHQRPGTRVGILGAFVFAVVLGLVVVLAAASPAFAFRDVPAGHAYEQAINGLAARGIIGGYADGRFGLNDTVKRAQFAKMIVNTLGIEVGTSTTTRFTDLGAPDANGYPHKFVQAAYDNGTNTAQTLFAPGNQIRRDQVISMIVRGTNAVFPGRLADPAAGAASLFSGVGDPHGANLRIAEANGLLAGLVGMGAGWNVTANATRGEVAQMLWNFIQGDVPASEATVNSDGSGDFPTLDAALAAAAPHTVINLGPGIYTLGKTATIRTELELIGSGMEGAKATTVQCAGTVVDVQSTFFSARDIRFVSTATTGGSNVIQALDARLHLEDCYFTGGSRTTERTGYGLTLQGASTAGVSGCVSSQNEWAGIGVTDTGTVTLEDNECSNNSNCGISIFKSVSATIRGNTCSFNDLYGINMRDDSEATVENNQCSDNHSYGISLQENTRATIRGNTCHRNGLEGIALAHDAQATIENNNCSHNMSGIGLYQSAVATIKGNTCTFNSYSGMDFQDQSNATVQNNTCADNTQDGIVVHNEATATITETTCTRNGLDGIGAQDHAVVTIENCTLTSNKQCGVHFSDWSSGVLRHSEIAHNTWGICAREPATAAIEMNDLHNNVHDYF